MWIEQKICGNGIWRTSTHEAKRPLKYSSLYMVFHPSFFYGIFFFFWSCLFVSRWENMHCSFHEPHVFGLSCLLLYLSRSACLVVLDWRLSFSFSYYFFILIFYYIYEPLTFIYLFLTISISVFYLFSLFLVYIYTYKPMTPMILWL